MCWIELLACLFCKILIAHCIYEGSLKRWREDLWDLTKNASVRIWNPTQCADDVSTVLGVSVVNELPDISFSLPLHLHIAVNNRFTRGINCIQRTSTGCQSRSTVQLHCITLDYLFLIALSSVGFVCRAIMWSDLHSGNFSWLLSCDVEHCCLPSST